MNANMKRLLIFALVPITVWGIGSTFTKQKIDRIGVNTESQITMEDTTRFSSGTASTVPYLDANKDLVSSSVTPTELGYLSGVSSSIQTQIDGKQDPVSGTANEIDFASDIIGLADNPILPGIEGVTIPSGATGDRPVSPNIGQFRWNTDNTEAEIYDGTQWGSVGGGAGGSRLNLLDDPSFEKVVANGSCTGCTASQDTTDYLATPNNEASLKMAFSAASGNYTWTESTSAQYSNVAGTVSAWIKTSASDCHFDELVDGTQSQTVAIGSSDEWKQYIINGTTGTTSYGWRVRCDTSITDDVFVDETFAGAAEPDVFDIGTASLFASVTWSQTTGCTVGTTSSSYTNLSADADCDDNARTITGMYNSTNGDAGNSDGQVFQVKMSYMPAGDYVFVFRGNIKKESTANHSCSFRFSDGTNFTTGQTVGSNGSPEVGYSGFDGRISYSTPQTSETTVQVQIDSDGTNTCIVDAASFTGAQIDVYHYPSPQKVVASRCSGLECINEFSAKISSSNVITNENVDWLTTSSESTNIFTVLFQSGLFSVAPNCSAVPKDGTSNTKCNAYFESTSQVNIACRNVGGSSDSAVNVDMMLYCSRGSDYKQFDSRFIPVIDQDNVLVQGFGNGGTVLTASVTNIDFTETKDTKSAFNGTQFTAPYTDTYLATGSMLVTANTTARVVAYVDGSIRKECSGNDNSTLRVFTCAVELNKDEVLSFRVSTGVTLSNNTTLHHVTIKRLYGDLKAFIGNLTPKEFVQTPGSTKPVVYSAHIAAAGTVSREFSNWINGNCTNANPRVCTYETGVFSSTPNCILTTTAGDSDVSIRSESSSSISFWTGLSGTSSVQHDVNITCHGVQ